MQTVNEQDNQAEILRFIEMAKRGDKDMKLAVVNLFKPMAYSMVYRSFYDKEEREEMYQEACLQILEAIEDFDTEKYRHVYFRYYLKNRLRFRKGGLSTRWMKKQPESREGSARKRTSFRLRRIRRSWPSEAVWRRRCWR